MYLVLNNAVRTESPNLTTTYPNYLIIDYIEIYEKIDDTKKFVKIKFQLFI